MLFLQDAPPPYVKEERAIPMRDGTKLYAAIYRPKEARGPLPILLERTPYGSGPYGPEGMGRRFAPTPAFAREGMIFVVSDIRGRYRSEGTFLYGAPILSIADPTKTDHVSDAYDTIEWLVKNVPENNGRVGVWGISQPGQYATHALLSNHPALVCGSPQAPVTDRWISDDDHRRGALTLAQRFGFMRSFGLPTPNPTEKYDASAVPKSDVPLYDRMLAAGGAANMAQWLAPGTRYWDEIMDHPHYDEYWKARAVPRHVRKIRADVLVVGGTFDAEDLYGPIATYRSLREANPKGDVSLVMGPWSHGGWMGAGDRLGAWTGFGETGPEFRDRVMLPWFVSRLKGKRPLRVPRESWYVTGENRWVRGGTPKHEATRLALAADGTLSSDLSLSGSASYRVDPADPIPFLGEKTASVPSTYMGAREDERDRPAPAERLLWRSAPKEKTETWLGPVRWNLDVATSGTDGDVVVKILDEDEKGVRRLVRWDVMRLRYRDSLENPTAMTPGRSERVRFETPDVAHAFLPGHRVVIQAQGSLFPVIDRNAGRFIDLYRAKPDDYEPHTVTIGATSTVTAPVATLRGR